MQVMPTVVIAAAQLLPFLAPVVGALVWWRLPRGTRARFAVLAVTSGVFAAVLVLVAGLVRDDPRPFVVDPTHPALFPHPVDNGFQSDHTAYAATAALVVATVRRWLGVLLLGSALVAGLARVLANVHHVQDIVGALAIAAAAVGAGVCVQAFRARPRGRGLETGTAAAGTRLGS
jgi:undecaprenyl-diphosphatase